MCGGGKSQTSTSQVTIPPEVLARYNSVNQTAETAAATPFKTYSTDPNAFVAGTNATEQKGISDISGAGGNADLGSLDVNKYMSPYLQDVVASQWNLTNQQNQQENSQLQGSNPSALGSDRSGVAQAILARQQKMTDANTFSNLLNTGFTQAQGVAQQQQGADLAARQADLARQAGVGQAEVAAGQVQQQTDQAGKTALYNQFQQQQAYPFQTAQFLANIAEGTGANSGSTTTSTQPSSFFGNLATGGAAFAEGGAVELRPGLAVGGFDPNAGEYGLGLGGPGASGYVPQATMPVGHLMTAPATFAHSAGLGTIINDASAATNAIKNAPSDWQSIKGMFSSGNHVSADTPNSAADNQAQTFGDPRASGGRAGLAGGGTPYESTNENGYVPDNTPAQTPQLATAQTNNSSSGGGLGGLIGTASNAVGLASNIGKAAKFVLPFLGLASGGRAGFADGGVDDPSTYGYTPNIDPLTGDDLNLSPQSHNIPSQPLPHLGVVSDSGLGADRNFVPQNSEEWFNGPAHPGDIQHSVPSMPAEHKGPAFEQPISPTPPRLGPNMQPMGPDQIASGSLGSDDVAQGNESPSWYDRTIHNLGAGLYNSFLSPANKKGMIQTMEAPPAPAAGLVPPPAANPSATGQIPPAPTASPAIGTTLKLPEAAPQSGLGTSQMASMGNVAPNSDAANAPQIGTQAPGLIPKPKPLPTIYDAQTTAAQDDPVEHVKNAIGSVESNHNFAAIGPIQTNGDRAYGAYQVMGSNIPIWTQKWFGKTLTPSQFLANPQAQEAVAKGQMGEYYQKFGNTNDVASMWFSGRPYNDAAGSGVKDSLGTTVPGYLQKVAAAMTGKPVPATSTANGLGSPSQTAAASPPAAPAAGLVQPGPQSPTVQRASFQQPPNQPAAGLGGIGQFFEKNKGTILPILTGLGAMASSPSRFLGSAILQGVGAGADSYLKYPKVQADIATQQAVAAHVQQGVQQNDIYTNAAGVPTVLMPNGTMTLSQWNMAGRPATRSQGAGAVNPSVIPSIPTAGAGSPIGTDVSAQPSQFSTGTAQPTAAQPLPDTLAKLADQNGIRVSSTSADALAKNPEINDPFTPAAKNANDSIELTPQLNSLANSLTDLPANFSGPVSSDTFLPYRKAANDLAQQAGFGPIFSANGVADTEEIKKITTQLANQTQTSSAAAALATMLTAFPSDHLSKQGQAQTVSNLLTTQQMMRDEAEYGNRYRSSIEQKYGLQPNQSQVAGAGFKQTFAQFEQPRIEQEKQVIEKMFNDPLMNKGQRVVIDGKPQSVLGYMIKSGGQVSPSFVKMLKTQYGDQAPDILRYFNGGANAQQ